jgi:hypothetical protein
MGFLFSDRTRLRQTDTETSVVEVIDHTSTASTVTASMSKRELKAYLVRLPPHQPTTVISIPRSCC